MQWNKVFSTKNWVNRYTITTLCFFVWISLLDSKFSWIKQYKLTKQLQKMEQSKVNYEKKLEEARMTYDDLMEDKEKFAREKYFIRKKGEDIYIIK
jgi:hypothetical protein